jgi:hypothetical protein
VKNSNLVTVHKVYALLKESVRNRRDLGLRRAIVDSVLDPENPFEPKTPRKPQKWFVLSCVLLLLTVGCFVYFNFRH